RVDVGTAKTREHCPRLGDLARAIDDASSSRLVAQRNVLGDRQRRYEAQLLMNHPDSEGEGLARRAEPDLLAVEGDRSLIRQRRAGEDLHQRRLARAILSDDRVNFSSAQ